MLSKKIVMSRVEIQFGSGIDSGRNVFRNTEIQGYGNTEIGI
jgi:hypothetical protein